MRNAVLSVLLFFTTMICVYFLNNSILTLCNDIVEKTEIIEDELANGEIKNAYSKSLELLDSIQEKNFITSLYLSHQEFDNLLNESVKLSTYLTHGNDTEAHVSLNLVKHNSSHIKKLQMSTLENIF